MKSVKESPNTSTFPPQDGANDANDTPVFVEVEAKSVSESPIGKEYLKKRKRDEEKRERVAKEVKG